MAAVVRGLPILLTVAVMAASSGHQQAAAQQQGYGQTLTGASSGGSDPTSRTGGGKGGSLLDSVNPIDLMNKINRSQAMEDATPPGDAVDAALREFATQSPNGAAGPTRSGSLKGP